MQAAAGTRAPPRPRVLGLTPTWFAGVVGVAFLAGVWLGVMFHVGRSLSWRAPEGASPFASARERLAAATLRESREALDRATRVTLDVHASHERGKSYAHGHGAHDARFELPVGEDIPLPGSLGYHGRSDTLPGTATAPPHLPPPNAAFLSLHNTAELIAYRVHDAHAPRCHNSSVRRQWFPPRKLRTFFDGAASSFRCSYRSPGEGVGFYCFGTGLVVRPGLVKVSPGGELVTDVMGRSDQEEEAVVQMGAFQFAERGKCASGLAEGEQREAATQAADWMRAAGPPAWGRDLLASLCGGTDFGPTSGLGGRALAERLENPPEVGDEEGARECAAQAVEGEAPALLFVHRYEYVNLFHTVTELESAHATVTAARKAGFLRRKEPVQVVFLDGHAAGNLDSLWTAAFPGYPPQRIGRLARDRVLCARRALFAQVGYSSDINIHPGDAEDFNRRDVRVSDYGVTERWCVDEDLIKLRRRVVRWAGAEDARADPAGVLVVMRDTARVPAHPRLPLSLDARKMRVERRIADAERLFPPAVQAMRAKGYNVTLAYLSDMPVQDQIKLMRSAGVVIGLHGAALMHVVFTDPARTMFVELSPLDLIARMHFVKVAARAGARYARFTQRGFATDFLRGVSGGYHVSPDVLEALIRWALLPTDEERLDAVDAIHFLPEEGARAWKEEKRAREAARSGQVAIAATAAATTAAAARTAHSGEAAAAAAARAG